MHTYTWLDARECKRCYLTDIWPAPLFVQQCFACVIYTSLLFAAAKKRHQTPCCQNFAVATVKLLGSSTTEYYGTSIRIHYSLKYKGAVPLNITPRTFFTPEYKTKQLGNMTIYTSQNSSNERRQEKTRLYVTAAESSPDDDVTAEKQQRDEKVQLLPAMAAPQQQHLQLLCKVRRWSNVYFV